ncbi:MAG: hypothetical protein QXT86_12260 [Archaeoglobaceae archaeon]
MVKLSELMRGIFTHLLSKQEPVVGFLLRKRGYKDLEAIPVSTEYGKGGISIASSQALLILPQRIERIPASLEELVRMTRELTTFLPVKQDVTLAGLTYMLCNPHFAVEKVYEKKQVGVNTYIEHIHPFYSKWMLIKFTDGSSFVVEGIPYKGFLDIGLYESVKQEVLNLVKSTYVVKVAEEECLPSEL